MTQINAYKWWNSLIYYNGDLGDEPNIPSPSEMVSVCNEISPILYVYIHDKTDDPDFWVIATDVLKKISRIEPFPDPRSNFPLFLLYFYTFRKYLKPEKVDTCILYVLTFCPEVPDNFFFDTFIYAVSNPVLVIEAFHKLDEIKNPQWIKFISKPGNTERFIDLFLPSLSPQTESDSSKLTVKIYLSNLLVNIFINHLDISLFKVVSMSLIKTLTELIKSLPDSDAIPFFRDVIALDEKISQQTNECLRFIFEKYHRITSKSFIMEQLFVRWCVHNIERITPHVLAKYFITLKTTNCNVLSILEEIALNYSKETSFIIIQYLTYVFFLKQVWMRSVSKIISTIISSLQNDELLTPIKEYITTFIHYSFIAITLFNRQKRYQNRILLYLTCLSSDSFMSFDWIKNEILSNASIAAGHGLVIAKYFFDIEPSKDPAWTQSLRKYKKIDKTSSKFLPFIRNKQYLIMFREDLYFDFEICQSDPNIAQFGVASNLSRYLIYDKNLPQNEKSQVIFELEDFIDNENNRIRDCAKNLAPPTNENIKKFLRTDRHEIKLFIALYKAISYQIYNYQIEQIKATTLIAKNLIEILKQFQDLTTTLRLIGSYFDRERLTDPLYLGYKKQRLITRKSILEKIKTAKANISIDYISNSYNNSIDLFNPQLLYIPFNDFDCFLNDFLEICPNKNIISKLVNYLNSDDLKSFSSTFDHLAKKILKKINAPTDQRRLIVHITLLRIVFGKFYSPQSLLNDFNKENDEFIAKANIISQKSVKSLELYENIFSKTLNTKKIISLLQNIQIPPINQIEYEFCPIDILYIISSSVLQIIKTTSISNNNKFGLIYYLIVLQHPTNSYAIMKFIQKYIDLCNLVSNSYYETASLFIQAVNQIYNFKT